MSFQYYVSFKSKKQGQHKAGSPKAGRSDKWSDAIAFEMQTSVPVDANTGELKGARMHDPVKITMEAGPASPQLLQALWTNEYFDEVVIEIVGRKKTGAGEEVKERITLTDAVLVNVRRYSDTHAKDKVEHDVDHLEELSFRFRQIQVENPIASTSASDDWNTPNA